MSRVLAFTLMRLLVALMLLECILAAFLPIRPQQSTRTHVSEKSFSAVFWTAFVAGSEGEKIEEISDKDITFRIADLQLNIFFLSRVHATPQQSPTSNFHHAEYSSTFLALLCTLII